MKKVYSGSAFGFTAEVFHDTKAKAGDPAFWSQLKQGKQVIYTCQVAFRKRQQARRSIRSEMNRRIKEVAFTQVNA